LLYRVETIKSYSQMQKLINIIVVENERMTRKVYVEKLKNYNINTLGEATNGLELLDLLRIDKLIPDIILLDLDMPIMNGREAFNIVRREFSEYKIIILTGYNHDALITTYLENGASAFVSKEDTEIEELAEIIWQTSNAPIPNKRQLKAFSSFTEGEMRIIPMICRGLTNIQIAALEGKAKSTIDGYIARMLEKTDTKNTRALVNYCTLLGLHVVGAGLEDSNQ
jgi:DNA-binding NarL/FixJ family response regulator